MSLPTLRLICFTQAGAQPLCGLRSCLRKANQAQGRQTHRVAFLNSVSKLGS